MVYFIILLVWLVCSHYVAFVNAGLLGTGEIPHIQLWFFTVQSNNPSYVLWSKTAVTSAIRHTKLVPVMMLLGGKNVELIRWMNSRGVIIVHVTPERHELLRFLHRDLKSKGHFILGAWIRVLIPHFIDEIKYKRRLIGKDLRYILYTDTDVVFQKDFVLGEKYLPQQISFPIQGDNWCCASKYEKKYHINSGVFVMNVTGFQETFPEFVKFVKSRRIEIPNYIYTHEQSILAQFFPAKVKEPISNLIELSIYHHRYFKEKWSKFHSITLPKEYEWEPYLGINKNASLIHWHGFKIDLDDCEGLSEVFQSENASGKFKAYTSNMNMKSLLPSSFEGYLYYTQQILSYCNSSTNDV